MTARTLDDNLRWMAETKALFRTTVDLSDAWLASDSLLPGWTVARDQQKLLAAHTLVYRFFLMFGSAI